ncbi:MAG: sigma 54-interacting transcriptional regulator [Bdellovibrionales bacterium]
MTTRNLLALSIEEMRAHLQWQVAGSEHQTELGEFLTIGRNPSNHIVLDDEFVSGCHARIERREGRVILRDMRSRNGTYLNGRRIFEAFLTGRDQIRIGQSELKFLTETKASDGEAPGLSSKNRFWQSQLDRLPSVAQSLFPVMITGPSGSGKELIAQHLHNLSPCAHGPFVSVNCSALSDSLVESELFGHVKGSFTGATHDRKGAFEVARGGTLFLDEIGDLPLELQPKLLRALENRQIRPVGSDKCVETDVRILAATHRDLKRMIGEGKFRADLYFRLHVVEITAPSLAERREDFEDILLSFAREFQVRFSFQAIRKLAVLSWPGNIRELRNVVARAKALFNEQEVGVEDLGRLVESRDESGISIEPPPAPVSSRSQRSVIREMEYDLIVSRLIANRGNQRRTAAELNMPKSTLNDRIKAFKIDVRKLMMDYNT